MACVILDDRVGQCDSTCGIPIIYGRTRSKTSPTVVSILPSFAAVKMIVALATTASDSQSTSAYTAKRINSTA